MTLAAGPLPLRMPRAAAARSFLEGGVIFSFLAISLLLVIFADYTPLRGLYGPRGLASGSGTSAAISSKLQT